MQMQMADGGGWIPGNQKRYGRKDAVKPVLPSIISLLASVLVLCLLFVPQMGWGASVTVRAQLQESTVYLGDSVSLELRIQGLREPDLPDLQHPHIDVTRDGGQSFSNSSISIINGRTTRLKAFGYVARYRLRPRVAGTLHIPPIAVAHEGRTYRSQPLRLVVRQPSQQDRLLVAVYTDKPSYVLGERLTLTLDLSIRKLTVNGKELDIDPFFREQPPHLQIPWFESLEDWKTADLQTFVQPFLGQSRSGFFINDYVDQRSFFGRDQLTFILPRQSTHHTRPTGSFNYFTYQLQKEFRPIRVGRYMIPPVLVKATLPIQIDTHGRAQRTDKVVASNPPLTVQVRSVPRAGQPVSFSGGVGRFRLTAAATPTRLKVGDPLTLTLTVHGEDDSLLETVHPLRLQDQMGLAHDFKIHTDPPEIKTAENTKRFTYTLRPRHTGVRAVPPLDMAYYDSDAGRYQVVQSKAVSLRVEKAATLDASEVVVTSLPAKVKSRLGSQLAEGLLANYTGPEVLAQQRAQLRLTPWMGGLLLLPPVAYVLTLLGHQWARQRRQDPGRQRSKHAARTALTRLRSLKAQPETRDATICVGIHRALAGYISDKLNLTGTGLTVDDIIQHFHTQGLEPELLDRAETLLHRCDNARYAPSTLAVARLTGLIDDAETLLQRLEARWRL
ncbi:hypothetical protein NKDENANG_02386 [Candidatus Entotheonellaceae bacterium PAL068K]